MPNYSTVPELDIEKPSHQTINVLPSPQVLTKDVPPKPAPIKISVKDTEQPDIYVKIYGKPPGCSDDRVGPNKEVEPSPEPTLLVDVLDAENEDPFTLESLKSLIELHSEKDLDFILARVTTVDPDDPDRFYYSYYAAHHINKVLFRTQPEEGLLHRMKAKNPLNNMTIVGDVHYYVIKPVPVKKEEHKPKSPFEALVNLIIPEPDPINAKRSQCIRNNLAHQEKPNLLSLMSFKNGSTGPMKFIIKKEAFESDIELQDRKEYVTVPKHSDVTERRNSFDDAFAEQKPSLRPLSITKKPPPIDTSMKRHRNIRSVAFSNERRGSMTVDDWIAHRTKKSPNEQVMSNTTSIQISTSPVKRTAKKSNPPSIHEKKFYEAFYYASDDDFLMHSSIRQYFKQNALETGDSELFTILTQQIANHDENDIMQQHPTLANLSFLMADEEPFRIFRRNKYLKYLVVLYAISSGLIVTFLGKLLLTKVPSQYYYVAGLSLFFLLCLFLIIAL
ncbi:hypothetical protein HK103_003615 [Boothiomyces macroporosus]|uniref:Uncharacterized protein n=1 Tax=Boothiomyces macroporosus TaxID=261099 RepID=A0AAD5UK79_9FUNG|nr:hypothetical protein HK103_003615 [Boothiomyces macroporosus]